MLSAPRPADDAERVESLHGYHILDTESDRAFDDLAILAAHICGTPIALVSLVDADRQWFKAKVGMAASETPRDVSFCGHAILADDLFIVEDARCDARFADNPLVTSDPNIRFYAGSKLMTSDGHALGSLCVLDRVPRKLTKAQEEALRALSRQVVTQMEHTRNVLELAEVVAERRQTEELKAAKHAAEAANRAKTEFLANISHELRTPLNGIIGLTEIVLESGLDAEQHENLSLIKSSADSLLSLVVNVLDFARIESGQATLEAVEYSPRVCLDDAIKAWMPRAQEKGLSLVGCARPDVPELLVGDAQRLRQIIGQLLDNAVKFTERGSIEVELQMDLRLKDAALMHCSVKDTGIGIPPEQQVLIFDVFTQGDGSLTRRHGGTGLGLTISSRLAARMGGRIWVDSEPGTGSKFHFTFRHGVRTASSRPALCSID